MPPKVEWAMSILVAFGDLNHLVSVCGGSILLLARLAGLRLRASFALRLIPTSVSIKSSIGSRLLVTARLSPARFATNNQANLVRFRRYTALTLVDY